MSETAAASGRLASIDLLRGVAVLMVVAFHGLGPLADLGGRSPETPLLWLRWAIGQAIMQGHNGVGLFLLISGFCIHLSFSARLRRGEPRPFLTFWKRRLVRIHPTFLLSIVFTLGLTGLLSAIARPGTGLVELIAYPSWSSLFTDLGLHLAMLHTLVPTTGNLHNAPYWSLALEEHLYLLYFPFLMMQRRWGLKRSVLAVLGISLSWHLLHGLQDLGLVAWTPLALGLRLMAWGRWFEWMLGVVLAEQLMGRIDLPPWTRQLRWFALLAIAGTWLSMPSGNPVAALERASLLIWGLAFFFLFGHVLSRAPSSRPLPRLAARSLRTFGLFSFSLYLIHLPVMMFMLGLAQHTGLSRPGTLTHYALMLVPTAVALAAARLFYLVFERHFAAWSGRIGATARNAGRSRPHPES